MLVEFWGDRAFGANLQRFISSGFIRLERIMWRARQLNQNRAKLNWISPKILAMQKNNHFSGVNLSSLKNSPELFKVESANVYCHANPNISHIAQRKHICILTDAHCVSLGFLWLNVKVWSIFHRLALALASSCPKTKSRTVLR